MSEGNNLFFYNDNKLVAVYNKKRAFRQNSYINADSGNTGVYVINKMRALNLQVDYDRLTKFINQTYNDVYSNQIIDALGWYYLQYSPNKVSDDKFIQELYTKINTTDINQTKKLSIPSKLMTQNNLAMANLGKLGASSGSLFCSQSFQSGMDLIEATNFIPFLSIITSGAKTIADISCGEDAVDL